jgi:hypothetical protein
MEFCPICESKISFKFGYHYCAKCEPTKVKDEKNRELKIKQEAEKELALEAKRREESEKELALEAKRKQEAAIFKSIPPKIISLYYITHIDNLSSIFSNGICSRRLCELHNLIKKSIANDDIVNNRRWRIVEKDVPTFLIDYVNMYFQPINAMLSIVLGKHGRNNIVILEIQYNIYQPLVMITDGNAAKNDSKIFSSLDYESEFSKIEKNMEGIYCRGESKWRQMAECLIYDKVPAENIKAIHISKLSGSKNKLNEILKNNNLKLPIIQNVKIQGKSF